MKKHLPLLIGILACLLIAAGAYALDLAPDGLGLCLPVAAP